VVELDALGDQRLLQSPDLCAFASVAAAQTGHGERALELVNLLPTLLAEPSRELTNRVENMRAIVAPCHPRESIELSATLSTLPVGAWRATARWARAVNLFLLGDGGALDDLRTALAEGDLAELGLMHANVLATISIIDEIEGRRDSAGELARRAQDQVGQQRAETVATTAVVSSATAVAMARLGDESAAREALAIARRHYGDITPVATWLNVIGRLALVRACLLIGDTAQGREVLQELRQLRRGDHRIAIDDHLDDLAAEVEGASTGRTVRRQHLTDAERRVLEHLPTNLSLSDIAVRLFVSRNTVKSHTAAIYRKLGVTSRTEAVEMARRTGLIEEK